MGLAGGQMNALVGHEGLRGALSQGWPQHVPRDDVCREIHRADGQLKGQELIYELLAHYCNA